MKEKIYVYSSVFNQNFIKNILLQYDTQVFRDDFSTDVNFKNNNVIFITDKDVISKIPQLFFSHNNVMVVQSKKDKRIDEKKYSQIIFFDAPVKIKQFSDAVKTCFFSKIIFYKDIKMSEQKIINVKLGLSCQLTPLETKILSEFVKNKKIKREYFLEKIFKIKKDIETKTVESHLTRIRKKLLKIKSNIKISSKIDTFFLED